MNRDVRERQQKALTLAILLSRSAPAFIQFEEGLTYRLHVCVFFFLHVLVR